MAAGLVILVFLLVAEFCAGELNLKCYVHIAMICIAPCMSWNGAFGFSRVCKTESSEREGVGSLLASV